MRSALLHKGVRSEKATLELKELLQILENEIKGMQFFGGNNIGFLDIVAAIVPFWITCLQAASGKEVFTREKYPRICTWADQMLGCKIIKQNLPDHDKLNEFYRGHFAFMNAEATNKKPTISTFIPKL